MLSARDRSDKHNRGYIKKLWWMPERKPWKIPLAISGGHRGRSGSKQHVRARGVYPHVDVEFDMYIRADMIYQMDHQRVLVKHEAFDVEDDYRRRLAAAIKRMSHGERD